MQLALTKFRKPSMNCLVCQYPKYDGTGREIGRGSFKISKVGEKSPELDPRAAYAVLSKYGDMLAEVKAVPPPAPPAAEPEAAPRSFGNRRASATKKAAAPQNK